MGLRYPKEKRVKKKRSLSVFRERVLIADRYECQDKGCKCHKYTQSRWINVDLESHHIISRSIDTTKRESVENGIALCRIAHRKAEEGHGSGPDRVSAAEYMIRVLESHQDEADFRWTEALDELKLRRDRKL